MKVSFIDLKAQNTLSFSGFNSLIDVINECQFVGGKALDAFEESLAKYIGVNDAVGVGSGTEALFLSLKALGVGPGDEVIVPSYTFIATAFAVSQTGAEVKFADVNYNTYLLDVVDIERAMTEKTTAIIPVHLFGNVCDMDSIMSLADKHSLSVVEDCAQAIGAFYKDKMVGSFGDVGCFSFYPTKNLGGLAQGGAVTTDNYIIRDKIRSLGNLGRKVGSWIEFDNIGFNSRLDTLNAAYLSIGLRDLNSRNLKRTAIASAYNKKLTVISDLVLPEVSGGAKHIYHLYQIRCKDKHTREDLKKYLEAKGIECGIYYDKPCHKQEVYREHNNISLGVSEMLSDTLLALPMHPELSKKQIEYVCDSVLAFYKDRG
jgi:dTDP-4-amino-4,6-dideoxygalactose transaminase